MAAQREWFEKDYYKVLGVSEKATHDEIRKAYRKLSKQLHPDSGGDEERFKEVSAAYDVLGDQAKRKEYDDVRKLGPMGNPFGGGGAGGNPFGGGGPGGFTSTFRVDEVGAPFDPNEHEAVQHEEGDGSTDGPVVAGLMRAGYRWKGRLVRAAMVTVKG